MGFAPWPDSKKDINVSSRTAPDTDTANVRESGGFKQSPEQLQRVHELAKNPDLNHLMPTPHARVGGNSGQPHAADTPHAPLARVGVIEPGTDEALQAATDAPIGSKVGCPYCGSEFIKRNAQHKFCCKEHRFAWHNERDPAKQQFLKQRNMKG